MPHNDKESAIGRTEVGLWWLAMSACGLLPIFGTTAVPHGLGPMTSDWVLLLLTVGTVHDIAQRSLVWRLAWLLRLPRVALGLWMNRLWRKTFDVLATPVIVAGLPIWVSAALTREDVELISRLEQAFEMIANIHPSRGQRLRRLTPNLLVAPTLAAATFAPGANLLVIDPRTLRHPIEVIAATLVHESNHARIASRQILHPLLYPRYERLARQDAILFAERLYRTGDFIGAHRVRTWATNAELDPEYRRLDWIRIKEVVRRLSKDV